MRFTIIIKQTTGADNSIGFYMENGVGDNGTNDVSLNNSNDVSGNYVGSNIEVDATGNLEKKLIYLDV